MGLREMRDLLPAALAALVAAATAGCAADAAPPEGVVRTEAASFRVVELAGGLEEPWAVAVLPGGTEALVTEKPGRLRLVQGGKLRPEPVAGLPEIYARDQGGLMDVALDPRFAENRTVYLSYSHPAGSGGNTTRVVRARYAPEGLSEQRVIFEAKPVIDSSKHFGSRLAFGNDGTLYVTMGERFTQRERAQDLDNHLGKVVRINTDGSAPADNPFIGRAGALPEIYSYGHRNPQGLLVDPRDGRVWEQEHGARGGDEINVLKPGANYGWPEVAYGVNYNGSRIGRGERSRPGVEQPLHYWDPSIAPSGMAIYRGDRFPGWKGDLLVGALKYELISRLDLDDQGRVVGEEQFLKGALGRVRDVEEGPDGLVYVVTDESPGGLYRLEPAS
jgi:glucose/arabinose dehydrogenase